MQASQLSHNAQETESYKAGMLLVQLKASDTVKVYQGKICIFGDCLVNLEVLQRSKRRKAP